ncbi:unnamed protein product [Pelagomonas calceolata]|uniref:Uncharacterized protein n=1 Tax=Pelagomonas calceolata TaxID=35677 RepID=A0A8J2SJU0_9STRA|nr:unnamed protein product [Pelagomonas calceolata]
MKIRGGSGRESDRGHFSGTFFRPLLWRRVRRRGVAGGVALHLFFLQSLGPRTPLLDQRGETGCYSSADCNLHQNTSVLSIIPSTCMMFAAITSSTPCSRWRLGSTFPTLATSSSSTVLPSSSLTRRL